MAFAVWESLAPRNAIVADYWDSANGKDEDGDSEKAVAVVIFLFFSQTFVDVPDGVVTADSIIKTFNESNGNQVVVTLFFLQHGGIL